MEPDFHNGEYLLVEKVSYRVNPPKRGDVVVFLYPRDPLLRTNYIKRIIGMPGETVHIEKGKVSINDKSLDEIYLKPGDQTFVDNDPNQVYEVTLSSKQFFVLGDNRQHSSDSREWGVLDAKYVIGRSSIVINPLSDFHAIASPSYH